MDNQEYQAHFTGEIEEPEAPEEAEQVPLSAGQSEYMPTEAAGVAQERTVTPSPMADKDAA